MTAKRGPSGGEMRGAGGRARVEGGEADHPSAAALRASLSTRDQVRACGVRVRVFCNVASYLRGSGRLGR